MLYAIAAIFLILWLAGIAMSYTVGGFIHLLLVAAVVAVLASLIYDERRS